MLHNMLFILIVKTASSIASGDTQAWEKVLWEGFLKLQAVDMGIAL